MAKKKRIFNNQLVTKLLKRYIRHKKDLELRDRILRLTMPLIEASMSQQGMFRSKEDIRQECILKVLQAIPKFKADRGNAFGFMWAVICNMSKTINKRLHKRVADSLSTDEGAEREAEVNGKSVFHTPENQYAINRISRAVYHALSNGNFRLPKKKLHRKACKYIQESMVSGDFFFDKKKTMQELKSLGLAREEIQQYCQYSLVVVRAKLLEARENASTITHIKVGKRLSSDASGGDN